MLTVVSPTGRLDGAYQGRNGFLCDLHPGCRRNAGVWTSPRRWNDKARRRHRAHNSRSAHMYRGREGGVRKGDRVVLALCYIVRAAVYTPVRWHRVDNAVLPGRCLSGSWKRIDSISSPIQFEARIVIARGNPSSLCESVCRGDKELCLNATLLF